jgi:hypothetical protein
MRWCPPVLGYRTQPSTITFCTPAALAKSSSVTNKPGANHVQWELALQFGLSARPHRMEQ